MLWIAVSAIFGILFSSVNLMVLTSGDNVLSALTWLVKTSGVQSVPGINRVGDLFNDLA